MNFQTLPNKETWEYGYVDKDSNHMFNSFLCTFLNIYQASFPVKYKSMKDKDDWITQSIQNTLHTQKKAVCLH